MKCMHSAHTVFIYLLCKNVIFNWLNIFLLLNEIDQPPWIDVTIPCAFIIINACNSDLDYGLKAIIIMLATFLHTCVAA